MRYMLSAAKVSLCLSPASSAESRLLGGFQTHTLILILVTLAFSIAVMFSISSKLIGAGEKVLLREGDDNSEAFELAHIHR